MGNHALIKEQLTSRLEALERRAGKIERDLRRPGDKDWQDRTADRENDEVLEGLDAQSREEIAEISRALARIESGEFGRCERCSAEISAQRLEVLPSTRTCLACAR